MVLLGVAMVLLRGCYGVNSCCYGFASCCYGVGRWLLWC